MTKIILFKFIKIFLVFLFINIKNNNSLNKWDGCSTLSDSLCDDDFYKSFMLDKCEDICKNRKIKNKNDDKKCGNKPGFNYRCEIWESKGFCEGFYGFWREDFIKEYCGEKCKKC
ncbi:hypothetical protein ACQ4LE_005422 [Meloidogyne hapla]